MLRLSAIPLTVFTILFSTPAWSKVPTGYHVKGPVCWRIPDSKYRYQALCPKWWEINTIRNKRFEDVILDPYKTVKKKYD